MQYRTANGYKIELTIQAAPYFANKVSNSVLVMDITDAMGMPVYTVTVPDHEAWKIGRALEVFSLTDESLDGKRPAVNTIEVPIGSNGCRYSIILLYIEPTVICMKILETNMLDRNQHSTVDLMLDTNDPMFGKLLGIFYQFDLCAIAEGYTAEYYYSHLEEFFNSPMMDSYY